MEHNRRASQNGKLHNNFPNGEFIYLGEGDTLTGYAIIAALTFLMVIIDGKMSTAIGAFLLLIRKMFPEASKAQCWFEEFR